MALSGTAKAALEEDLEKSHTGKLVTGKVAFEEKNPSRTLFRLMQLQRQEQEEADQIRRARDQEAYRERCMEQEETLARELNELRRKEICEIRERQKLRESSHELKELEAKLRSAYTKRELQAQMAENQRKKLEEKLRTLEVNKQLEEARVNDEEFNRNLKLMEMNKKYEYRKELQDQIIYKAKMKQADYEEYLREKMMIDQIVQRINLEDERFLQEKWMKMQKTKEEMDSFKKAQEIWRARQREQLEAENKRIQEYMFTKQTDTEKRILEKRRKEKLREELVDNISKQIYEQRTKQRERDEIQQDLFEQERMESDELREQKEIEKRFRQRIEMITGLDEQVNEHKLRKQQIAEEDAQFKKIMKEKEEEEQKLEFMSADKRRIRKIQLGKDLQEMIAERRRKQAENMEILLRLHEEELDELAERNRKIEQERIKLLKEHAEHLIGYMPPGILREEDLSLLGPKVSERYKPKPANQ